MVMRCAVEGCQSNSAVDKVGYFTVPTVVTRQDDETREISARRRSLWIARLGERYDESKVTANTRVCGKHFISGKPARLREQLSVDWLPTIGVHIKFTEAFANSDSEDSLCVKNEPLSPIHVDVDIQMEDEVRFKSEAEEYMPEVQYFRSGVDKCCQADILSEIVINREYFNEVIADNVTLRIENSRLKAKICEFSEEELNGDDSKVEFFTGLPTFSALKHVFEFVSVDVKHTFSTFLSKFQEFMVVMVWLRLNLDEQDLAYRFGVCHGMISALINKWLKVMATSLSKCIHSHEREVLCNTMPDCFKVAFENKLAVIIDCLEIPIQTSSSFLRADTSSPRNHHKLFKAFIVFTPQSTVSFISKGWVSQQSHEMMIERCNILDNILPGDIVISKCPLNDSVGMFKTKLNIPAFSKGRTLSPTEEIQAEKEIANIIGHIEKVNDLVKRKFRILQSPVPLDYLKRGDALDCWMDHILTICCALININHSESGNSALVFL